MPGAEEARSLTAEEIAAMVREIRERVRARYPHSAAGGIALPDLTPLLHARDAAEGKVAAIGTVNPRPPGLLNDLIQAVKRLLARLLDWHVREQVEFNRAVVRSLDAVLEALNENNRALAALAAAGAAAGEQAAAAREQAAAAQEQAASAAQRTADLSANWSLWRQEWEHKLATNELQFLRSVAELQAAFQHRTALMEANVRETVKTQHADFRNALDRAVLEIQQRVWADFEKVRTEFERLIHTELRLLRQRSGLPAAAPPPAPAAAGTEAVPQLDWMRFAETFRGSPEDIRNRLRFYLPFLEGCRKVVDLGCGRGEFLELMQEAGIEALGVDHSAAFVELCRRKGLRAEEADLLEWLRAGTDSFDAIFCAHVVEHLPPAYVPELVRLAADALVPGGLLLIETPNPHCLAIFATHFYLDPTHVRPVPAPLLRFYMEEAGFSAIQVHWLGPASESFSALGSLPQDFRETFFGGLDYAIIGRKL
ncbi:MAG TPA: class I SAM-dependent methyltransferase [Bryobacteraceae bacterium]|nr:class I SAM-dependent methyltransferase [Bryobacteraceae bacterium]